MLDRIIARLRRGGDDTQRESAEAVADDRATAPASEEGEKAALWLIDELGLGRRKRSCSLWQVDHRVAFSDGGADCGLGNLRTLCLACHLVQTRELHRGKKVERRG